jgi:MFS family permease
LVLEAVLLGGAITSVLLAFEDMAWLLVVALVLAVWWGRLPGSRPVLTLVRRRLFGLPLLTLSLVSTLGGVMFFLVPYHVTDVLGGSPEDVGVALLVFVAGVAALALVSGSLTDRYGPWLVAMGGSAVSALALGLLMLPVTSMVDLCWRLAVPGVGQGLFNTAMNTLVMSGAPEGMEGTAGGLGSTARMVGTTVGPAVAALAAGLAGSADAGFRTGVAVLTAVAVVAVGVLASAKQR